MFGSKMSKCIDEVYHFWEEGEGSGQVVRFAQLKLLTILDGPLMNAF